MTTTLLATTLLTTAIALPALYGATSARAADLASHPSRTARSTPAVTRRTHLPAVPGLTISIIDGRHQAQPGDLLRYTVQVRNGGTERASNLKITLTFPAYLTFIAATPRSHATHGIVTWQASLSPGGAATFLMSARLKTLPRGVARLAAVACAIGGKTTVCAAHLDRVPGYASAGQPAGASPVAGTRRGDLTGFALAGLAVALTAVLAALTARRIRTRRPRGLRHRHSG